MAEESGASGSAGGTGAGAVDEEVRFLLFWAAVAMAIPIFSARLAYFLFYFLFFLLSCFIILLALPLPWYFISCMCFGACFALFVCRYPVLCRYLTLPKRTQL